jgi:integrase
MGRLTDVKLRALLRAGTPIAGRSDGDGLTFTLSRAGRASWVLRYRHGGRPREVHLGNYPDMALEAARIIARAARVRVDQGVDVADERRKMRLRSQAAKTFRRVAENYLERAGRELAERSRSEVRRYFEKDLYPRLGHLTAADISPQDIVRTVERIAERSDSVARHAFELLSVVFAHALARQDVVANPCAGLRLASILGPRPERRARLKLSADDLRALLETLDALGKVNALVVKILLATCVRKGELIRAQKQHIDLDAGIWFVPDEHSKSGKGYVVPLAPTVVGWFRELWPLSGEGRWILPALVGRGRFEDRPMSDKTLNAALVRCAHIRVKGFTPHDLRSTARSHLAELGVGPIVAERCLNHSLGGLVAVYDQHDYLDERRRALELWAARLVDLAGNRSNVVALRAAA